MALTASPTAEHRKFRLRSGATSEVSAGAEDSSKVDPKFIWSSAGGFSYWINDWLDVALRYGYFSSKTASGGGSSGRYNGGTRSLTLRPRC
jgi:hypothetical protein